MDQSDLSACVITTVHSAQDARIFHKQCRSLVEHGWRVTLIAPPTAATEWFGVKYLPLPTATNRVRRVLTLAAATRFALRQRHDVYHLHDPELLVVGALLTVLGRRVVFDSHEDIPDTIRTKEWLPRWARRPVAGVYTLVERLVVSRLAGAIGATDTITNRLRRTNHLAVTVANWPRLREIGTRRAAVLHDPTAKVRVGYLGAIAASRGADLMLDLVVALNRSSGREVCLVLAGRLDADYRAILKRHPGWRYVEYLGQLELPAAYDLMASLDIGIHLTISADRYGVAWPTKMLEYLAMGMPVVVPDYPILKAVTEEARCGFAVDTASPVAAESRILELIADPDGAREMGRRGRELVERRFTWELEAEQLFNLYERVVSVRGRD